MPRRAWLAMAFAAALAACTPTAAPEADAVGPLLPGLAPRLATLETIEIRGAGDRVLVTLDRGARAWTVGERDDWPADPALVRTLLDELASARAVEAKTTKPGRYARIGVEPVAGADAGGVEVRLRGKDWNEAVIVGATPPAGGGRFVRHAAQAQAWRVDRPLFVPREPVEWIDTLLLDEPLPRVDHVVSRDDAGHEFALVHRDDRFRIADAPSAAMGDSYRGDTLAAVLTGLRIEDVAADEGAAAERTVLFALKDGRRITLESRRIDGRVWVRVRECPSGEGKCDAERWRGRRFLLPAHIAANLWLTRGQILAGEEPLAPPPPPQITQEAVNEALQRALQGDATPQSEPGPGSR